MKTMDKEQAKAKLATFLDGRELTFSMSEHENDEWIAQCNEIPAITTGGIGKDITNRDKLMRGAILAAANIDPKYMDEILRFVGYKGTTPLFYNTSNKAEYEFVS